MALHVFFMYCYARVISAVVGHDVTELAGAALFSLAMLIPLVWAVVLPDLPEIIRRHLARRRWSQGYCPACGYVIAGAGGAACPECGGSRDEPEPYRFGWDTAVRFAGLALGAWVVGSVAAQTWITIDENQFRREAQVSPVVAAGTTYSRPRIWPMSEARLFYSVPEGVAAVPPHGVLVEELAPDLPRALN